MFYKSLSPLLLTTILITGNIAFAGLPNKVASTKELADEFEQRHRSPVVLDELVEKAKASGKALDVFTPDVKGKAKKTSGRLYYVQNAGDLDTLFQLLTTTGKESLSLEVLVAALHSMENLMTPDGTVVRPNLSKFLYSGRFQSAAEGTVAQKVQDILVRDFKSSAGQSSKDNASSIDVELLVPQSFTESSCHPCFDLAIEQIGKRYDLDHSFKNECVKTDALTYEQLKAKRGEAKQAQNQELIANVEIDFNGFLRDPLAVRKYIEDVVKTWSAFGLKRAWDQFHRAAVDASEFDLFAKVPLALMTAIFEQIGILTDTQIAFYSVSTLPSSDAGPSDRKASLSRDVTFGPQKAKHTVSILWDSDVTGPTLTHLVGLGNKVDKELSAFEEAQLTRLREALKASVTIKRD